MPQAVQGFPDAASHMQSTTLGGTFYRVRQTWSERLGAWYVDLYTEAGAPLILGRRMSAGWVPWSLPVVDGLPTGQTLIRGVDGYGRDDLGDTVRLVRFDPSEIPAAPAGPSIGVS